MNFGCRMENHRYKSHNEVCGREKCCCQNGRLHKMNINYTWKIIVYGISYLITSSAYSQYEPLKWIQLQFEQLKCGFQFPKALIFHWDTISPWLFWGVRVLHSLYEASFLPIPSLVANVKPLFSESQTSLHNFHHHHFLHSISLSRSCFLEKLSVWSEIDILPWFCYWRWWGDYESSFLHIALEMGWWMGGFGEVVNPPLKPKYICTWHRTNHFHAIRLFIFYVFAYVLSSASIMYNTCNVNSCWFFTQSWIYTILCPSLKS